MNKKILITGVSGTGKSTVAEALKSAGHQAIDMDEVFCTMYYKDTKEPVVTNFENHDLGWVKSVEWICDTTKLRKYLDQPGTIFCCGGADNLDDVIPLFDTVVLLDIDDETLRSRLTHRTNNNWGQTQHVQEWLLGVRASNENRILKHGVMRIDANRNIQYVVGDILVLSHA